MPSIKCHSEWIVIGVHKYLTEYYFLHVHAFYHDLLGCFFIIRMPWYLTGKRCLLTCMQHIRRLTRVLLQHTKHYSHASYYHAAHKILLACSARNIAHIQFTKGYSCATHFVSHACFDLSHDKNWRTHTCSLHASVNLDVNCTAVTMPVLHTNLLSVVAW